MPLTRAELVERCKARGLALFETRQQGRPYLWEPKSQTSIALPDCKPNEELPAPAVEAVCEMFGFPYEDFGLDPDPDLN